MALARLGIGFALWLTAGLSIFAVACGSSSDDGPSEVSTTSGQQSSAPEDGSSQTDEEVRETLISYWQDLAAGDTEKVCSMVTEAEKKDEIAAAKQMKANGIGLTPDQESMPVTDCISAMSIFAILFSDFRNPPTRKSHSTSLVPLL